MKHLITIKEIKHFGKNGKVIWQAKDLPNIFHNDGEEFMLKVCFSGEESVPANYYFGLDKRSSLLASDNLASLVDEPNNEFNGYRRQSISSEGQFVINTSSSHYYAKSPIIHFSASGGSWGPVNNLFLSTVAQNDYDGYLLASVPLSHVMSLSDGESMSVVMGLSLKNC
jgi:hypothetical protein